MTNVVIKPRKLLLYGPQGVGKSRLAALAPGAETFDMEEGTNDLDCRRWPRPILDYPEFQNALSARLSLGTSDGVRIVNIDSLTKLQELVKAHVCRIKGTTTIEDIGGGFGKGKALVIAEFVNILKGINALIRADLAVVMTAHATEVKHSPPDAPSYTEYAPDLMEEVRDMYVRYSDEVFFMRVEAYVNTEKTGFGGERNLKKSTNVRQLVISDAGAICAKHRLGVGYPNSILAEQFGFYLEKLAPPLDTITRYAAPVAQVVEEPAPELPPLAVTGNPFASANAGTAFDGGSIPAEQPATPSNEAAAELASTDRF